MHINEFVKAVTYHSTLNPKLWTGTFLKQDVRHKLLAIAKDFVHFIGLPQLDLKDITISGSNASYGYSEYSDVDLHLIVAMPDDPVVRELFDAKKNNYNFKHKIQLHGIDVEVYVQDDKQTHHSAGIFSVLNDRWITKPEHMTPEVTDKEVRQKARSYAIMINKSLKSNDLNTLEGVAADLKRLRQAGLARGGEFSVENLAFKLLRSRGKIDAIHKSITKLKDAKLSLEQYNES
jgi:hypothetical protein